MHRHIRGAVVRQRASYLTCRWCRAHGDGTIHLVYACKTQGCEAGGVYCQAHNRMEWDE